MASSWRDLISSETKGERQILPWTGGTQLRIDERTWNIQGNLPREFGWWPFLCGSNRAATYTGKEYEIGDFPGFEPQTHLLKKCIKGYLVGDRIFTDVMRADTDPLKIWEEAERVFLLEAGIERFARIEAGRLFDNGPLIYKGLDFPRGPEGAVATAFENGQESVREVHGLTPALEAAFRMETFQREEKKRRRAEAEKRAREEEERLQREERRKKIIEQLGDGAGRRALAKTDFGEAAKAALAVGGAVYLDHRLGVNRNEMVVVFRLDRRRFECTCRKDTLQIIDSGICLTAHYDDPDGFDTGTKGDTLFTLESLPGVIKEAERQDRLVVYRHVD